MPLSESFTMMVKLLLRLNFNVVTNYILLIYWYSIGNSMPNFSMAQIMQFRLCLVNIA